jgi:nucleotide-binding universal stress UspA family protein
MLAYVEKHWPDLVTGTHGGSGVQPGLIAGLAEGLLKSLSCDVLAVPTRQ